MLRSKVFLAFVFALIFAPLASADPPAPPIPAYLDISGEPVVVYDWSKQHCENGDMPDVPARAFRDADGMVQFIDSANATHISKGPSLLELKRSCKVVSRSFYSPDPARHTDQDWLASVYTEDGKTIYALIHDEYHGNSHPGRCPSHSEGGCVYNTTTLAVSTDGGKSYSFVAKPPAHFVAALPGKYEAGAGPHGLAGPSNMIKGKDGHIYSFFFAAGSPRAAWTCLLRTDNLADPKSWRAWDGVGFGLALTDPYGPGPHAPPCAAISAPEINQMQYAVSYNTYLGQYVLIDISGDTVDGRFVVGIYYAFSTDLIHWSHRQLLKETEAVWTWWPGDGDPIAYPSLLDPNSPSRNFETTGEHAFMYFTRFNKNRAPNMDLLRVPVTFSKAEVSAPQYEFKVSGVVPPYARTAQLGYRFNDECQCSGTADLTLYALRYGEGPDAANIVPNSNFTSGLTGWAIWGSAPASLGATDLGPHGQALTISVKPGQSADMNGTSLAVTPGAHYTATFVARVREGTTHAGYFTLIFLGNGGESRRDQVWATPNEVAAN